MTATALYSGSATIGTTEYSMPNASTTLGARTDAGVIQLQLDLSALAAGDAYQLTFYTKVGSGGTLRKSWTMYFRDVQTEPSPVSPAMIVKYGWDWTLKKIAGTDRSISWDILTVP